MVSSFRSFMASRNNRAATYAPPTPRVYQPDPNYAPFQESPEYDEFKVDRKKIEREGTSGFQMRGFMPMRVDTTAQSVENLRNQKQTEYDDRIRQRRELDDTPAFIGVSSAKEEFDPNKESGREFIARDKALYVEEALPYMSRQDEHPLGSSELEQAEELYYQQVLTTNGISSAPFPLLMPTNERIRRYEDQVTKLLSPIEIAGQKTQVTGLQQRQLQKTSGPRRARAFAGIIANPMNEEFIPIATAQAMGAMPGAALGNETLEKAGATAGEWVGFGFGGVSAARSLRWMTEDITLPFKIIRGSYRAIHKKFGSQGLRKPAQLSYVIDNAGQAPPSVSLDANERKVTAGFTAEESLAYAARDAGGTPLDHPHKIWVRTESQIRAEGQVETVHSWQRQEAPITVVDEGEVTKTYQITDTDSYFKVSGEILNLSPEQIEHASNISRPIIKALADSFGIDETTYIQGLVPAVREVPDTYQPFAARTIPGGKDIPEGMGDAFMDSIFRRAASLIEFVKTNPELTNDADSVITIQHELAHIVLADIFRLVSNGKGGQSGSMEMLANSLKNQVLVRAHLTGEDITSVQRQALNDMTVDDIAAIMGDDNYWSWDKIVPPTATSAEYSALRASGELDKRLLAMDLQKLLHEAGADLFAKYTLDVARGERTSAVRKEAWGLFDTERLWQAASKGLNESLQRLKEAAGRRGIAGIAEVRSDPKYYSHDQKIVDSFSSVIEEIAEGKIYVDKKMAPQQLTYLAMAHARRTNTELASIRMMADSFLGNKRELLSKHRDEIEVDLMDSDIPHVFDGSNARYQPLARMIFKHPSYEPLYKQITSGNPPDDDYFRGVDELRDALVDVLRDPKSKVAPIHDISPEVRARLELVNETPELLRRVRESAFKNDAGEPIVSFTGAGVDYGQDFQHRKSRHFGGLCGPGKYWDDWDVVGGSYAVERYSDFYEASMPARIQAFYSLVPESKTMSLEGFGSSDPVGLRYFETVFADDEWVRLNKNSLREFNRKHSYITHPATPKHTLNTDSGDFNPNPEARGLLSNFNSAMSKLSGSKSDFRGLEATFGENASRRLYRNFLDAYVDEIKNWRIRTAQGRREHFEGGELGVDKFSETDDRFRALEQMQALEDPDIGRHLRDMLESEPEHGGDLHQIMVTAASIKATARTVADEIDASQKIGTWGRLSLDDQLARTKALRETRLQVQALESQQALLQIEQLDNNTYELIDNEISFMFFDITNDLIRNIGNQHVFEVMKSASRNNAGSRGISNDLLNELSATKSVDEFTGLTHAVGVADRVLFSMRNRAIHERMHGMVRGQIDTEINAIKMPVSTYDEEVNAAGKTLDKWLDVYNGWYMKSDVHQLTEVGGAVMGGSPHRVGILVGPDEVIQNNYVFVRLKGIQNTPDQAAAWKKRNPQAPDIENTVRTGELGVDKSRYGNEVKSGMDRFNEGLNQMRKQLDEQNVGANPRAVENPVQAGAEILDVQKKTEAGQVINTGKTDGKNIIPSSFKYEDYFGTSIRKPINKELLDSVLTDTTGEFRTVTGEITPEGQRVLAESASERITAMLKNKDYRAYIKTREKDISAARTRAAAMQHEAADLYAAGKIDQAELEKRGEIAFALSESVKSGYKPIEMHPIEVQALLDHGVRKLQELYPSKVFDQRDFTKAINKFLGIETARRGTAAFTEVAQQAPALKGMAGTRKVARAEGLTPREQNLVEQALGLDTVLRDESPLTRAQIVRGIIITFFNVQRQLLLSIDAGAIFNQGGLLLGRFTTKGGYVDLAKSLKGTLSEANYKGQMDQIKRDSDYDYLTTKTGIFISELDGPLSKREEGFMFNIFRLAGVQNTHPAFTKTGLAHLGRAIAYPFKSGERFHNLYLNKMRYSMLRDFNAKLVKSGVDDAAREAAIKNYADFLNKATGRGDLGKLSDMAPELATVFLAPRWMVSRVQVPYSVVKTVGKEAKAGKGMYASKQIAKDLTRTFGVLGGISTLLFLNGFRVETDARKSNFLKASNDGTNFVTGEQGSGKVNIDLTMGLGSVWRFIARASYGMSARKEVTTTGTEFEADVGRQIGNFMRSKLSPLGSSVTGLVTGNNYFGEEVTGREMFIPGQSTDYEDFLPLMMQQIMEASREMDGGPTLALLGAGAVGGLNVNVYPDKDDLAREIVGESYEDLYPYEQKYINRLFYEGGKFQPSDYTQQSYQLELDQYEAIEIIMGGTEEMGTKASRVYRVMDKTDLNLQGLRMGYFKDSEDEQPETDPLKKAQNDYYDLLSEIYGPEGQSSLSDEEIEQKKLRFLSGLSPKQRDYIQANKTNFMVPDSVFTLIKPEGKGAIRGQSLTAQRRLYYKLMGRSIPEEWELEDPMNLGDKYYAVAKNIIYSNEARRRLSEGRAAIPTAPEQIEITRGILERVN